MSDFLLSDIKGALEDAQSCIQEALRHIEDAAYGYEDPEEYPQVLEQFFASDPDVRDLYAMLRVVQKEIDILWTPALKARLKDEEEEQSRLEDLADANSY